MKREVHMELDELCPPKTIQTTNTSSLLLSDIESVVNRGDKFAAFHFNGGTPLLDITGGPRTSPATIDILKRFAKSIGLRPVVIQKEKDGYLSNSILISIAMTALLLVIDGHAEVADVDRSYMMVHGQERGPFAMMDGVGLNVMLDIFEEKAQRTPGKSSELRKVVDFLRPFIDRGELGVKTGKGFYSYPNPAFLKPDFLKGE